MLLGMEVDLGLGHIVLDGDPACLRKGHSSPPFRFMPIVAKWWPMLATAEHLFCVI